MCGKATSRGRGTIQELDSRADWAAHEGDA